MMNTYFDFKLQYTDYETWGVSNYIHENNCGKSSNYFYYFCAYIEYFMDLYWLLSIIHFKISKFDNWIKACL